MSRNLTDKQLNTIAQELIGQCISDIDDICRYLNYPTFEQWTTEDAFTFDLLAFCCTICNWWVSGDDHTDIEGSEDVGFVCSECGDQAND